MPRRWAFISGVSRGIGEGIARFLLAQGWKVFGVSRTPPRLKHPAFAWHRCDIADSASRRRLFTARMPKFDLVIHNAATGGPVGSGLSIPDRAWRRVFDVNFFSHLEVTRRILRHCKSGAAFVFLSGRGAASPRPFAGPYAISKLAAAKLAEQLALEYKRFRFYALAPGAHDTRMSRSHLKLLGEPRPEPTDFRLVEELLARLIVDRKGHLNGRLLHVRDHPAKLLSLPQGGYIRRIEKR